MWMRIPDVQSPLVLLVLAADLMYRIMGFRQNRDCVIGPRQDARKLMVSWDSPIRNSNTKTKCCSLKLAEKMQGSESQLNELSSLPGS